MNKLLDEWSGLGEIESRDVGPYRCLITFSSPEIRDNALNDELLLSIFDEVRLHWNFVSSLSRRIWIEIIGLPVNMWCVENLNKITNLWGKMIHEWISIRMDDKVIDVFVKEFGSELYSVESHLNRGDTVSETMDDTASMKPAVVLSVEEETSQATANYANLNSVEFVDPLIDVIINKRLDYVHHLKEGREKDGEE
ncbi:hypothetical protein PIB30_023884 [Stylosanthes scabra]|uniref:DUF4283 domain-containing protein n=1 Tax=Stylosanthes scabra TaxID=79078 RepID=A0ABU6T9B1_9FABA|nr:hypothetical protein [Stylosanthes scabra]